MELKDLRVLIDEIDQKMKDLFLRRLEIAQLIKEYKLKNDLPVLDKKREEEMFKAKEKEFANNEKMYKYYEEFLKNIIKISKDFQNE